MRATTSPGKWPWRVRWATGARVAFVGGAVVNLYSTRPAAPPEPRVTDDVDCVVEVAPRAAFYQLEDKLRQLGFVHDINSGVICRWQYQGLTVNMLPADPAILHFGNPLYVAGMAEAITYQLPDDTRIWLLPAVYYLAIKMTALRDRGWDGSQLALPRPETGPRYQFS